VVRQVPLPLDFPIWMKPKRPTSLTVRTTSSTEPRMINTGFMVLGSVRKYERGTVEAIELLPYWSPPIESSG
jgi:hypothetical protein